jgi:hypothetical protein
MKTSLALLLTIAVFLVVAGCSDDDGNPVNDPNNEPPVIESIVATPDTFIEYRNTNVIATASDPDGHSLEYNWQPRDSRLTASGGGGASIQITNCCDITEETSAFVVLTVSDGHGGQAIDSVEVTVIPE